MTLFISQEKYYYSIYDMTVRGSCSCYGHAERCLPEKEEHKDIVGMVHGKCDCTHNTKGNNCEYCLDMYQDVPWRPAQDKKKNECKSENNVLIIGNTCTKMGFIFRVRLPRARDQLLLQSVRVRCDGQRERRRLRELHAQHGGNALRVLHRVLLPGPSS